MGKGSKRRPGDDAAFSANYERIFRREGESPPSPSTEKPIRGGGDALANVSSSDVSMGE